MSAWCAAVAGVGLLGTSEATGASLNVLGGQLVGASNVDVGGASYDLSFQENSCRLLFTGCEDAADFTLPTAPEAEAAGYALLNQVFVDGDAGSF